MTDAPPNANDPFSSPSAPDPGMDRDWDEGDFPEEGASSWADRSAFAMEMARMWVKEHQTATMLGAFAVGVFVGSLSRD
jgi:hypothetical protein